VTSIVAVLFLWITAIYVKISHRIAINILRYFEVLIFSIVYTKLIGCEVGVIDSLFQVTHLLTEMEVLTNTNLFGFLINIVKISCMFIYTLFCIILFTHYFISLQFVVLVVKFIRNVQKTLSLILLYTFLVFLFILLLNLFNSVLFCEGSEQLPYVIKFNNLHVTDVLRGAKESLQDASGVYYITNKETGQIYIGSSINLYDRIMDHLIYNCRSNAHLQFAIEKFGLAVFIFKMIELCTREKLLEREQHFLDWLFSLSEKL